MDSHKEEIEHYIAQVVGGKIVTGRLERLAVWRHKDDLEHAGERGYYFDEALANHAINFSKFCRQFESPFQGKPLVLRVDQKFAVWCLFGWRRKIDGMRRFRHCQWEIGRKNGKSTLTAYLCLLMLFADRPVEHGAQIYVAATKQEQAKVVWSAADNMLMQSPSLLKRAKRTPSKNLIELPHLKSKFVPLAADKTPDGFNPHLVVKDEEHAWRKKHLGQAKTLKSGFGVRAQPLTITITTYGDDESELWLKNHDYGVRVLESVITGDIVNDEWLVLIFAIDCGKEHACFRCRGENCEWCGGTGTIPNDDPYDERVWRKANPGAGEGVGFVPQMSALRTSALESRGLPDQESEFFQKNLNIIVRSRDKIIAPEAWAQCRCELSDWKTADRVHGGCDIGRSDDMFGLAAVARFDMVDDKGVAFTRFELRTHAVTCEKRGEDISTPEVKRWVEMGVLGESPGDQILFSDAEAWALSQTALWGVRTWAYDPSFGRMFGQNMQHVHGLTVFPFTQSAYHYNTVTRLLPKLLTKVHIVDGKEVRALGHDGCPVLAWMMRNLIVVKNAKDEWMPDKGESEQKIDIAVSVLMAISECLYSEQEVGWVYQPGTL